MVSKELLIITISAYCLPFDASTLLSIDPELRRRVDRLRASSLLLTLLLCLQFGQDGLVLLAQSGLFEEIRSPFEGPSQRFRSSP